jgi:hypothetical protein
MLASSHLFSPNLHAHAPEHKVVSKATIGSMLRFRDMARFLALRSSFILNRSDGVLKHAVSYPLPSIPRTGMHFFEVHSAI